MRPLSEYIKRPKLIGKDLQKGIYAHFGLRLGSVGVVLLEILLLPVLWGLCVLSRHSKRPVHVGLGPEPLVNNIYHKRALERYGYWAETFVYTDNFISSDYDINLAKKPWSRFRKALYLFVRALFRYQSLFIYFNGGPLFNTHLLRRLEPHFYRIAGIKVVVMPFGSDVQLTNQMSANLYFKHVICQDYPHQAKNYKKVQSQIDRWTEHADWVISGCEWVDYMPHWNTLQVAHFSIDTEQWMPVEPRTKAPDEPFRIFHAPNHKRLKGTAQLIEAVARLKSEGLNMELVMLRGVPNHVIRQTIEQVDLVADQFIIGWYAMFAIESMALGKPVLCYLREDLIDLYTKAGLIEPGEIPLINTDVLHIEEVLRWAYENQDQLKEIGERGPGYVQKHHSLQRIGEDFCGILQQLQIVPDNRKNLTPLVAPRQMQDDRAKLLV